jgi:hypothetical protein
MIDTANEMFNKIIHSIYFLNTWVHRNFLKRIIQWKLSSNSMHITIVSELYALNDNLIEHWMILQWSFFFIHARTVSKSPKSIENNSVLAHQIIAIQIMKLTLRNYYMVYPQLWKNVSILQISWLLLYWFSFFYSLWYCLPMISCAIFQQSTSIDKINHI